MNREKLNIGSDVDEVTRSPGANTDTEEQASFSGSSDEEDLDSQSSDFLAKEMPRFQYQPPACFCNGGAYCQKHQGKEVSAPALVRLLKRQFRQMKKDEDYQNKEMTKISTIANEVFVSRRDVSVSF